MTQGARFRINSPSIVNETIDPAYAVLRAIYLTRRYGDHDRPDVELPLAELAAVVAANRATDPAAHARRLIASGATGD